MDWTNSSTRREIVFGGCNVKSFTKSCLTSGFMLSYVYLACLLILSLVRVMIRAVVDFLGWSNAFGLRNPIARERGIAAYRAWVPFERIRPANIPQEKWEEAFAWPLHWRCRRHGGRQSPWLSLNGRDRIADFGFGDTQGPLAGIHEFRKEQ
jgi:hypothetical protein